MNFTRYITIFHPIVEAVQQFGLDFSVDSCGCLLVLPCVAPLDIPFVTFLETFCHEALLSVICSPGSWKTFLFLPPRHLSSSFVHHACELQLSSVVRPGFQTRLSFQPFDDELLWTMSFVKSMVFLLLLSLWADGETKAIFDPFYTLSSDGSDELVSCKCLGIHQVLMCCPSSSFAQSTETFSPRVTSIHLLFFSPVPKPQIVHHHQAPCQQERRSRRMCSPKKQHIF